MAGLETSSDSSMRGIVSCDFEDDSERPSEKRLTADTGVDSNWMNQLGEGEQSSVLRLGQTS